MKKTLALAIALGIVSFSISVYAANMDHDTVKSVQEALNAEGFDCGTPDGLFGNKTGTAISNYQESMGLTISGEIDDDLLNALGLTEAGGMDEAAAVDIENEEAWNQLYDIFSQTGMPIDGMKGFFVGADDYHTTIGIVEGDEENIYLYTKGDYGEEGTRIVTDLSVVLPKNTSRAAFTATSNMDISYNGITAYTYETGTGYMDIPTVNAKTELAIEQYEKEILDINGGKKTSTDVSESTMNGQMQQSLEHLLTDAEQILHNNTSLEMKDLGFYSGITSELTLSDNEFVKNIHGDVYAVFPSDWVEQDTKGNGVVKYCSKDADENNIPCILYAFTDIKNMNSFGYDDIEKILSSGLEAYNKDGRLITEERTNIEIGGMQARSADVVQSEQGDNYSWIVSEFAVDDGFIAIVIKQKYNGEVDYTPVYQRIIDTVFVDATGIVAAELNSSIEDGALEKTEADEMVDTEESETDNNVLIDNEIATVTYIEPIEESYYVGAKLLVENHSDTKTIMVDADNTSVNGYMEYMSVNNAIVSPGMKSYAELRMYTEGSPVASIDEFVNVKGMMKIWYNEDGGNSFSESTDAEEYSICSELNASDEVIMNLKASQELLFDSDSVTVGYLDTFEDGNKFGAKLLVENKTDNKTIMVDADNTAIDGFMTYLSMQNAIIAPGMVSVCELTAYDNNEIAQSLEQFFNVTGTFVFWYNEDGSNSFSGKLDGDNFKILEK